MSPAQAVMVSDLELCGGQCLRGANCSNPGSYYIAIYVRSGKAWRKASRPRPPGGFFLSRGDNDKFKVPVLNVFSGNKDCSTHDIPYTKKPTHSQPGSSRAPPS